MKGTVKPMKSKYEWHEILRRERRRERDRGYKEGIVAGIFISIAACMCCLAVGLLIEVKG